MPPAPTRLVLLLGTAAVASATTLTTHAPGRSSNSADRHAVHALSATHNIVLREQLQQEQEQEQEQLQHCRRLACLARLRGGEEEKVEGDCIGIDLGTTCTVPPGVKSVK
jgi:hypothetical protein